MKLVVRFHGYCQERVSDFEEIFRELLAEAGVKGAPTFESLPLADGDRAYIEILTERKKNIYPILEELFARRMYHERVQLSGAANLLFEAGDFANSGWITKWSRYKSIRNWD